MLEFLRYIGRGDVEFSYNDIGMPKIMRMIRECRIDRLRKQREAEARRQDEAEETAYLRIGRDSRREMANRGMKAVRDALNGVESQRRTNQALDRLTAYNCRDYAIDNGWLA